MTPVAPVAAPLALPTAASATGAPIASAIGAPIASATGAPIASATGAPASPSSALAPVRPDPKGFGEPCRSDADCGWDDPCVPTRCTAKATEPASIACDESASAPGKCLCVSSRCMLRPNRAPAPPTERCERFQCGLDEGAGRCVVGSMREANWPPLVEGPMCDCDARGRCQWSWVDKVPCKTDAQCWVLDEPRQHPVFRTGRFQRKFRPCEDAEALPACVDGFCGFGLAFGC